MIICGSVLDVYFAIFFVSLFFFCYFIFFFFEVSPGPWFLQILVVGLGPGTLVVMFLHRY